MKSIELKLEDKDFDILKDLAEFTKMSIEDLFKKVLKQMIVQSSPVVNLGRLIRSTVDLHNSLVRANDTELIEAESLQTAESLKSYVRQFLSENFAETINRLRNHYGVLAKQIPDFNKPEMDFDNLMKEISTDDKNSQQSKENDQRETGRKNFFEEDDNGDGVGAVK